VTDHDRWQRNVDAVREMLARVSAGDTDGYLAHLAPDAEYVAPYYPEMAPRRSREEIASMLGGLFARFAQVSYTVTEVFETVDPDLVICEARGDNQVLGSDRRYRNHYVMFVRFRAGEVVHWTEYSDPNVYHRAVDEP
jgi:uncharacterized protein